jgi:hypothetical protein
MKLLLKQYGSTRSQGLKELATRNRKNGREVHANEGLPNQRLFGR